MTLIYIYIDFKIEKEGRIPYNSRSSFSSFRFEGGMQIPRHGCCYRDPEHHPPLLLHPTAANYAFFSRAERLACLFAHRRIYRVVPNQGSLARPCATLKITSFRLGGGRCFPSQVEIADYLLYPRERVIFNSLSHIIQQICKIIFTISQCMLFLKRFLPP